MASFTLKNIPDPLFSQLRASAALHHRSINGEILARLERSFVATIEPAEVIARARELRSAFRGRPLSLAEVQAARETGRR